MGAKLKSKTHLQNTFFDFLSRFLRVLLQSLKKVLIWPKKNFFEQIKKVVKKRRILRWFRICWKICEKIRHKKVISKTSLTNMSKSEKVHFSVTFLLITFFCKFFQNFFNGFEISVKFWVFWHLFQFFQKRIFYRSYLYFFQTLTANVQETAQKNGKSFFMNVS
jgi:hypothetical protein